jgi:CDGSH-type Zn-finger protein
MQPEQTMTTIKVTRDGPLKVDGADAMLVDWNGAGYTIAKRSFYLCRCGASTNKPFGDGTHSKIGFKAVEAAVPGGAAEPAN